MRDTDVVSSDPDALFARAVAHGAKVLQELYDTEYGSRDFAVEGPEPLDVRHLPGCTPAHNRQAVHASQGVGKPKEQRRSPTR